MRALSLAVLLLLVPPAVAADDFDSGRPLIATAIRLDDSTLVSWSPGADFADYFNVYGVQNNTRILLESVVEQTFAEVASGFLTYEVTAVADGKESAAVTAVSISAIPLCVVAVDLPNVYVGCSPKVAFEFRVELVSGGLPLAL